MQPKNFTPAPAEKIISILSYFTMGIAGLIWILIAYFFNKRLKFFLMYNIIQSIIMSIFLAVLNLIIQIVLQILAIVPGLYKFALSINLYMQQRIEFFALSFNIIETVVFFILMYMSIGIVMGKIFYFPILTPITKRFMQSYR